MKKFLVIYGSPVSAREQMMKASPEQARAGMQAWMAWMHKAGRALVDGGAPLGNAARVSGGTASDVPSELGGFSILQAESRDALAALLADHPHTRMPGATIEVHEFLQLPGM
ncbi:MAG TPA: YciI family protein [Kofleriaceae bacterium]|nr:YciI family protein [Kofleriaceae bacterium]